MKLEKPATAAPMVPSRELEIAVTIPLVDAANHITFKRSILFPKYELTMDVLMPRVAAKLPAVVFIPGGGFFDDDTSRYIQQRVKIAEAGYAVACIEYRIIPQGTYKEAVADVKSAIRYLRAHADEFHIDGERIAVMGDSAGGYLAALTGTTIGNPDFEEGANLEQSSAVCAVIDLYGLSDLNLIDADFPDAVQQMHDCESSSQSLFVNGLTFANHRGCSVSANAATARAANPLTYISGDEPPFLLMHGDKDVLVSPSQTEILHQALVDHGVESTRYVVRGADHAGVYWNQPEVMTIIIAFLDAHLK